MKGKRKIRRRPGVKRNMYFNMDTQASIEKYKELTGEENSPERMKIYQKEILPAFEKLSENLIHIKLNEKNRNNYQSKIR